MGAEGVPPAPARARRLDCAPYHHPLDVAGGSGIYACAMAAQRPHLRATVLEKTPALQPVVDEDERPPLRPCLLSLRDQPPASRPRLRVLLLERVVRLERLDRLLVFPARLKAEIEESAATDLLLEST